MLGVTNIIFVIGGVSEHGLGRTLGGILLVVIVEVERRTRLYGKEETILYRS